MSPYSLVDHMVLGVCVGSFVTMVMFAYPLLWLRNFLHRISRAPNGESWGTCGYCCAGLFTCIFLIIGGGMPRMVSLTNAQIWGEFLSQGWSMFLSFLFVHIVAVFTHYLYCWLTDRPATYPSLGEKNAD